MIFIKEDYGCELAMFLASLMFIDYTNNYKNLNIKVKRNNNFFSKDTYYLVCDICKKNMIKFMLMDNLKYVRTLHLNTDEFKNVLTKNEYNKKDRSFKTKYQAEQVANYISRSIGNNI